MQEITVSPSNSSSKRSTPWVLGCCGPMLSSTVSPSMARLDTRWRSSSVVISTCCSVTGFLGLFLGARFALLDLFEIEGELHFFVPKRVIFAQRVPGPILGHQDAAQVGVIL